MLNTAILINEFILHIISCIIMVFYIKIFFFVLARIHAVHVPHVRSLPTLPTAIFSGHTQKKNFFLKKIFFTRQEFPTLISICDPQAILEMITNAPSCSLSRQENQLHQWILMNYTQNIHIYIWYYDIYNLWLLMTPCWDGLYIFHIYIRHERVLKWINNWLIYLIS
jgi:hypothetical protein